MHNKYTIQLSKLIPTPWLFPLNKEGLNQLLSNNPRTERNDFKTLYLFALATMKVAGVVFSSPGASEGRRFIYWFNSHFWTKDFKAPKFDREDFIFKEVNSLLSHLEINISLPDDVPLADNIVIKNSSALNELGRKLIFNHPSFTTKKVEFV